jgi:predicted phosphodiesterase
MKILVVSDIHANRDALNAVLDSASSRCAGFLSLGDVTGYGPDPEECVRLLMDIGKSFDTFWLLSGNHEAALSGKIPASWFNLHAQLSVEHARSVLSPEASAWLDSLPSTASVADRVLASHASPLEPLTGYLWGGSETKLALSFLAKQKISLCFCGHTHEAAAFGKEIRRGSSYPAPGERIIAGGKSPLIINPGSVGFPRSFNGGHIAGDPVDPNYPGVGEPISVESFPAYYAIWDTADNGVLFCDARYDRGPMEARLAKL